MSDDPKLRLQYLRETGQTEEAKRYEQYLKETGQADTGTAAPPAAAGTRTLPSGLVTRAPANPNPIQPIRRQDPSILQQTMDGLKDAVSGSYQLVRHPLDTGKAIAEGIGRDAVTATSPVEGDATSAAVAVRGKGGRFPGSGTLNAGEMITRENTSGAVTPKAQADAGFSLASQAALPPILKGAGALRTAATFGALGAANHADEPVRGFVSGAGTGAIMHGGTKAVGALARTAPGRMVVDKAADAMQHGAIPELMGLSAAKQLKLLSESIGTRGKVAGRVSDAAVAGTSKTVPDLVQEIRDQAPALEGLPVMAADFGANADQTGAMGNSELRKLTRSVATTPGPQRAGLVKKVEERTAGARDIAEQDLGRLTGLGGTDVAAEKLALDNAATTTADRATQARTQAADAYATEAADAPNAVRGALPPLPVNGRTRLAELEADLKAHDDAGFGAAREAYQGPVELPSLEAFVARPTGKRLFKVAQSIAADEGKTLPVREVIPPMPAGWAKPAGESRLTGKKYPAQGQAEWEAKMRSEGRVEEVPVPDLDTVHFMIRAQREAARGVFEREGTPNPIAADRARAVAPDIAALRQEAGTAYPLWGEAMKGSFERREVMRALKEGLDLGKTKLNAGTTRLGRQRTLQNVEERVRELRAENPAAAEAFQTGATQALHDMVGEVGAAPAATLRRLGGSERGQRQLALGSGGQGDAVLNAARRGTAAAGLARALPNAEGLTRLTAEQRATVQREFPDVVRASDSAAQAAQRLSVFQRGLNLFRAASSEADVIQLERDVAAMSPADRLLFRKGAYQAQRDQMLSTNTSNAGRTEQAAMGGIGENPLEKRLSRLAYPDGKSADVAGYRRGAQRAMRNTNDRVLTGTTTAEDLADKSTLGTSLTRDAVARGPKWAAATELAALLRGAQSSSGARGMADLGLRLGTTGAVPVAQMLEDAFTAAQRQRARTAGPTIKGLTIAGNLGNRDDR